MSVPGDALCQLPEPAQRNVTLRVDRSGARALLQGHPWLFASGVERQSHDGRAGDLAVMFDERRRFVAIGLYDPVSPIRVRVLAKGTPTPIDHDFFARRVTAALAVRRPLLERGTTGYRCLAGENEQLPGLVIDRYGETLVIRLDTPAWLPHLRPIIAILTSRLSPKRVVLRLSRGTAARGAELHGFTDGSILVGSGDAAEVRFTENRLVFACDPVHGHKTGFFLDQRENRERVERFSEGRDVLDLFAYTGGFSLYAARGGARSVLSVDQSAEALQQARRNFELNTDQQPAIARVRHETRRSDVFEALRRLAEERRRFDVVVIDPPAFASKQADVAGARAAYQRLTERGLAVLERGGHLVMASCSSRVSSADFFASVHAGARRAGRRLDVRERTGHALDHPVGFEQGAYLKCLFAVAR